MTTILLLIAKIVIVSVLAAFILLCLWALVMSAKRASEADVKPEPSFCDKRELNEALSEE